MMKPQKTKKDRINSIKILINKMNFISDFDQEAMVLITTNSNFNIIGEHLLHIGSQDECKVNLGLVMSRVVMDRATRFWIGHNHPNGSNIFSKSDYDTAVKLLVLSQMMEIHMMDSILFPYGKKYISMKKYKMSIFTKDHIEVFETFIDGFFS